MTQTTTPIPIPVPAPMSQYSANDHDPSTSEPEPTITEWLRSMVPTAGDVPKYMGDILLCTRWLPRYNLSWLTGDAIAGLTVGFVVIPQAMAYALLAGLSPEYGLYTSFVGAVLYWVFGSSKDIVIGVSGNHHSLWCAPKLTPQDHGSRLPPRRICRRIGTRTTTRHIQQRRNCQSLIRCLRPCPPRCWAPSPRLDR